jgi:hypothetical protein
MKPGNKLLDLKFFTTVANASGSHYNVAKLARLSAFHISAENYETTWLSW